MISPERWTNNRARIKEKRTRSDFKASVFGILLIWEMLKIYVFDCICTQTFLAKDDMIRERAQNGWNSLWNSILHHISFERPFRDGFEWGVEPARSEPTTCEIVLQRDDTHRNEKKQTEKEKNLRQSVINEWSLLHVNFIERSRRQHLLPPFTASSSVSCHFHSSY